MNRNEIARAMVPFVIITILMVSFFAGLFLYFEATRDPYDIEISTNDPDLISSFHLNSVWFSSSDFPFNITIRQKSFECWINIRYKVFDSGAYIEVVADRVFFNYQSLIDNNGFVNVTYANLYILFTLLPDGT